MSRFQSVSILLPTLNETFSFIQTVEIILQECDHKDIKEFIAIVCERTESASLNAIETAKKKLQSKMGFLFIFFIKQELLLEGLCKTEWIMQLGVIPL